ncbi:MAG: hypothetical protein IPK07_25875 [Deltaproteobacteria bacterium]|nr:hypothetical protein [Deltaproteobacteria bacterium]
MQPSQGVTAIAHFLVAGHHPAELFSSVRRAVTLHRFTRPPANLVVDPATADGSAP